MLIVAVGCHDGEDGVIRIATSIGQVRERYVNRVDAPKMGLYMIIRHSGSGWIMSDNPMRGEMSISDLIGPLNAVEQKRAPSRVFVQGDTLLARMPRVSIVGTREPSSQAITQVKLIVEALVAEDIVIVSGLARGVDTAAHRAAMMAGGRTIAVIGTPLDACYPDENRRLQEAIAQDHLLVSQFEPGTNIAPSNFPARNLTMALISDATIIVEAGEKSGTRHQGWEAIRIGRPLFILEDVLVKSDISWARSMLEYGAQVLNPNDIESILDVLPVHGGSIEHVGF